MEILLRSLAVLLNFIGFVLEPIIVWWHGAKKEKLPPIRNQLLKLSAVDLIMKMRRKEVKSEEIVRAYIERIKEVNPYLNAVVEDRFEESIADAKRADRMVETTPALQLKTIYSRYPLLGIPFTVKEACGLKGMSQVVGNIHRVGLKSPDNGDAVEHIRSSGGIPLLVSANPEFCMSWETTTLTHGRCNNPFDTTRTPGGSSGGEGALNGAGATLFGIGSDIAGSIRVPSLYNGIFGHKPTGGLVSVKGHFPYSTDEKFGFYLQLGPMTRFAKDLPLLLTVMAGKNADKLKFTEPVETKDIKIFYMEDNGFTLTHSSVDTDIKISILQAVNHFKRNGLTTKKAHFRGMSNAIEMCLSSIIGLQNLPRITTHNKDPQERSDNIYKELIKFFLGKPKYTIQALCMEVFMDNNGFMSKSSIEYWVGKVDELKTEILDVLGNDGVLFFPTSNAPALHHSTSVQNISAVGLVGIMNSLGLPATHVPMGLNKNGLPIGFQVIGAPFQDKLCLQIAGELEAAFGGWVAPT